MPHIAELLQLEYSGYLYSEITGALAWSLERIKKFRERWANKMEMYRKRLKREHEVEQKYVIPFEGYVLVLLSSAQHNPVVRW